MDQPKLSRRLRRIAAPLAAAAITVGLAVGWSSSHAQPLPSEAGPGPLVHQQSLILQVQPDGLGALFPPCSSTSLGQSACLVAVFTTGDHTFQTLDYSTKACAGDPSLLGFLNDPCTAAPFLTSSEKRAVENFPGTSCPIKITGENAPSSHIGGADCRVDMYLSPQAGGFNAAPLCLASYFLTGPCTAAVVSTTDRSLGGGDDVNITNDLCPIVGDIQSSCTAQAFQFLNSDLVIPAHATQPVVATPTPTPTPVQQPINDNNAAFLILTPDPQFTYFQPTTCASVGQSDIRCVAALLHVTANPGSLDYPSRECKLSISSGNKPCTAPPYDDESSHDVAVHNYPGSVCVDAAMNTTPCEMFVIESPYNGEFVAPGLCSAVSYISSPCTIADFDTSGASGGDTLALSSRLCPVNLHFTDSCVAPAFLGVPLKLTLPASY
jgi:hypothetical protein